MKYMDCVMLPAAVLSGQQVDDSRKTLSCAVTELLRDIQQEQQQHMRTQPDQPWVAPELGVFVVHNKQRPKLAQLPEDLMKDRCA
jgi:hypoxanthine phosphoribosyltransferase